MIPEENSDFDSDNEINPIDSINKATDINLSGEKA